MAHRGDDALDVLGRRAAAATDDVHAEIEHELAQRLGERSWSHRVQRAAPVVDGQAGVGNTVHRRAGVLAQVADGIAHQVRAGGAVEPDDVDVHRLERRERTAIVGAEQHAPGGIERDRALDRHLSARDTHGVPGCKDLRLHLEHVLARLEDQQIRAALEQTLRLVAKRKLQLGLRQLAQLGVLGRRQESRWPHGPGDEPRPAIRCGVAVGDPPRDGCGGAVQLDRALAEPPLLEPRARGLERVRLDDVSARVEVGRVNVLDHVRPRQRQVVDAAVPALATIVLGGELARLHLRAHAAVEEHDAVSQDLEVTAGHAGVLLGPRARALACGSSGHRCYRTACSVCKQALREALRRAGTARRNFAWTRVCRRG